MTYTCAVYADKVTALEDAQYAKYDLVARKLGLKPGMRAAGHRMRLGRDGASRRTGIRGHRHRSDVVSAAGRMAAKAVTEAGVGDIAEIRHCDYRDVAEERFDAISSIGLTEHVGPDNLADYFSFLYDRLRPGGRLLNHCITKPDNRGPALTRGGFISTYVFPDGGLSGPGTLASRMHDAGFELRHEENLREHYALTLADWVRNLEADWDEAVNLVGEETARAGGCISSGRGWGSSRTTSSFTRCWGYAPAPTVTHTFHSVHSGSDRPQKRLSAAMPVNAITATTVRAAQWGRSAAGRAAASARIRT